MDNVAKSMLETFKGQNFKFFNLEILLTQITIFSLFSKNRKFLAGFESTTHCVPILMKYIDGNVSKVTFRHLKRSLYLGDLEIQFDTKSPTFGALLANISCLRPVIFPVLECF